MIAAKKMILAISTAVPACRQTRHGRNQRNDEKRQAQPSMAVHPC
jgi:hypothetical protein